MAIEHQDPASNMDCSCKYPTLCRFSGCRLCENCNRPIRRGLPRWRAS